jgi:uncharacterized surface protein with fasciclin (FAS1) repeats
MIRLTATKAAFGAALLAAVLIGAAGITSADAREARGSSERRGPSQQATLDIVDTAVAAGDFTTLAAALEAADLIDTLKGPGPFTVFAPTDAAFAALPAGTVEALLADVPGLTDVLLYHVVAGDVRAADVVQLDEATTVQGSTIAIAVVGGQVRLNDTVTVTTTDIVASNGVIHVIDGVLLPPPPAAPGPPAAGNAGLADQSGSPSLAIPFAAAGVVAVLVLALGGRYASARLRAR